MSTAISIYLLESRQVLYSQTTRKQLCRKEVRSSHSSCLCSTLQPYYRVKHVKKLTCYEPGRDCLSSSKQTSSLISKTSRQDQTFVLSCSRLCGERSALNSKEARRIDLRFANFFHCDFLDGRDSVGYVNNRTGLIPTLHHRFDVPPFLLHGLRKRRRILQEP